MQQHRLASAAITLLWYHAPHWATARRPGVEMMSIILLLPVAISTDRSTDWPCALDMCNTARSFTHRSNTCVIRRLAFLNLGFIEQMSCTPSLPPSTTSHRRILVCPRTSKSWDCSERINFVTKLAQVSSISRWLFCRPVDRSRSISTVDKDSPTWEYGWYQRSIRIYLLENTVGIDGR